MSVSSDDTPTTLDDVLATVELFAMTDPSARSRRRHRSAGAYTALPGLKEIARYGGYSVYRSPQNTDSFIRETLKLFDPDLYGNIYGFTRRPTGVDGMYKSLSIFGEERREFSDLSTHQRSAMKTAIGKARSAFKLTVKHEPLDWHEVGQYMRRDTSAGVSFPGKKKGDVLPQIYTEGRWQGHRMKQGGKGRFDPRAVRFPPCLATQRGGLSEVSDPKTRLAWIYPAEMLMVEGLYAPVMYREFEKMPNGPMLIGKSSQRLFTEWVAGARDGMKLYGLDFSKFDCRVPAWLIKIAFDILHSNVDWLHWRGKPTSKRSRQKWRNVWDGMVWYFINTPILMPDGRMFRKYRGVPSGSWWTQLVDSVVNYILVEYMAACQNVTIKSLKVLGDDSAFSSCVNMNLSNAADDARAVGMVLSVEKSDVVVDATQLKLLGTTYRNGHAHRPREEWFKLALYPENEVKDVETSLSRLIGLWIGGGMWDTHFSSFMHYFQRAYPCPSEGWFTKDQRRWLEIVHGGRAPRGWTTKKSLFWRSIFYVL